MNRSRLIKDKAANAQSTVTEKYQSNCKLFVYGSLGPGQSNAHLLNALAGTWKEASVTGYLQETNRARGIYYPLLRPHPEGEAVDGHVFISDALPKHWSRLDQFEGPAYTRLLTLIAYKNGQKDVANVYADASCDYL